MLRKSCQILFWGVLIFTFVYAEIPRVDAPQMMASDKSDHFLAFYGLAVLAAAAFPGRRLMILALQLSAFGAIIELVQALPIVNRDGDFWDWVADTIGITFALGPILLASWRCWLSVTAPSAPNPKLAVNHGERVEKDCPSPRPKMTA